MMKAAAKRQTKATTKATTKKTTTTKITKRKASTKAAKKQSNLRTKKSSTSSPITTSLLSITTAFTTTSLLQRRRFFSTETAPTVEAAVSTDAAADATSTEEVTPTITKSTTISQSTSSSSTDPDAPQLYMGPDLYVVRPTNVREATRVVRAFCNKPVDQPISLSINLGLDPRKPNQSVRGMAPVPHGSGGKTILAVFAQGDKAIEAREAGADIVGAEDLIKEILTGKIEFTRCIATPDMMKHLSKVARVLGPRGLMPNPKLGTVTTDIKGAVESSKLGQIAFRNDKKGVVHAIIGKSSWSNEKLEENINAFVKAIGEAKPSGAKGQYFKSSFIGNNGGWSQNLDIRLYPFKQ